MFHGKPLYAAIAQRKEERQAQLQLQFAQRVAGLAGQPGVFSGGYPPYYYPAPGMIPQVSPRPGLMYQPLAMRPGWRANGFASPSRPAFQPSHLPAVCYLLSFIFVLSSFLVSYYVILEFLHKLVNNTWISFLRCQTIQDKIGEVGEG